MKTYAEIFNEVACSDFVTNKTTEIEIENKAAKEYAKQWVDIAADVADEATNKADVERFIMNLKKEIDDQ